MIRPRTAFGGWFRMAVAAVAGASATLALPPVGAVPVLAVAVVVLVRLLDGVDGFRSAASTAFAFALAYFASGLYWVAWSFLVPGPPVAYYGPAAVLLLAVLLACFLALPVAVAAVATRPGPARAFGVAAALALGDWLRGHLLTGFPWNLFGHAWSQVPGVEQTASVVGVYGLGFATLIVCALFSMRNWRAWAGACLAVALAAAWGHWRMSAPAVGDAPQGPLLRLVQPNVPQREKWLPENREEILRGMIALGEPEGAPLPDAVIWPETAVPLVLTPDSELLAALGRRVASRDGLILGIPLRERGGQFNSVVAINREGRTVARHDKAHLVPFGEYVPLRRFLGPLKLTTGRRDFTPGPGLTTMSAGGIPPFSALVCYEVIFPGDVVGSGDSPRLAAQSHQRRLVRRDRRSAPAFRERAVAFRGDRPAAGPGGQYGDFGGGGRSRPGCWPARARATRALGHPPAPCPAASALCEVRGPAVPWRPARDGPVGGGVRPPQAIKKGLAAVTA